jgi:hypothetical protein
MSASRMNTPSPEKRDECCRMQQILQQENRKRKRYCILADSAARKPETETVLHFSRFCSKKTGNGNCTAF